MKAQVKKKCDRFHTLKVKEAMSSVDKFTVGLQRKDSTLKNCFDHVNE